MSEPLSAARPDFFGKDSCTPFIGVIEDVDDPKHSGRVKVRCVGWHPLNRKEGGEDGLKTEDLPWARVGMPVTHAQQSRIGGKHGLLPGCWVFGFFLDGDEAQDPFVMTTFNFTSKTSTKDNRKDVVGETGTLSEQAEGFDKVLNSPATQPNTALRTDQEKQQKGFSSGSDKAGDNPNNDSDNNKCGGKAELASSAENAQRADFTNPENTVGNIYEVDTADGRCGGVAHNQEDIQRKMKERMPSNYNRFSYGDVVWERFSGNYMDLNGILAQLSLDLCALLKQLVEAIKAEMEEKTFRQTKGAMLVAVPGRNPELRIQMDDAQRRTSDIFHTIIALIIDQLCMLIMSLLQKQNNGDRPGGGSGPGDDNSGGDPGADPTTPINNPGAPCVSETFINNFEITIRKAMNDALVESNNLITQSNKENSDSGSSLDNILGSIMSVLGGLGGSGMLFAITEKYTEKTQIHNSQGNKSQDKRTREGCRQERTYNTAQGGAGALGFMQAMAAAASGTGASGGGETSGSSTSTTSSTGSDYGGSTSKPSDQDELRKAWLLRGRDRDEQVNKIEISYVTCEEGGEIVIPDPGDNQPSPIPTVPELPGGGDSPEEEDLPEGETNIPEGPDDGYTPTNPGQPVKGPGGDNIEIIAIPLPSPQPKPGDNFRDGTPNVPVITNPGFGYYNPNPLEPKQFAPEIWIPGYSGDPTPVIDPVYGEIVALITIPEAFDPNFPQAPVSVIPGQSSNGILTDDPNYDFTPIAFFIGNTGFNYVCPKLTLIDKDNPNNENTGEYEVGVLDGRIVEVSIINSGTGFKRIPEVQITDACSPEGYGAKVYPIMGVIPKVTQGDIPDIMYEVNYCPSKGQKNIVTAIRNPLETVQQIVARGSDRMRNEAGLSPIDRQLPPNIREMGCVPSATDLFLIGDAQNGDAYMIDDANHTRYIYNNGSWIADLVDCPSKELKKRCYPTVSQPVISTVTETVEVMTTPTPTPYTGLPESVFTSTPVSTPLTTTPTPSTTPTPTTTSPTPTPTPTPGPTPTPSTPTPTPSTPTPTPSTPTPYSGGY